MTLSIRRYYIPLLFVLLAVLVASLIVVLAVDHSLAAHLFAVMSGQHAPVASGTGVISDHH